jgi:hypothetical protein
MRVELLLLAGVALAAPRVGEPPRRGAIHHYQVASDDAGAWPRILESIGLVGATGASCALHPCVYVIPGSATAVAVERFRELARQGSLLIVEGDSPLSRSFGILPGDAKPVSVRSVIDSQDPKLDIVWEKALETRVFTLPPAAQTFTREKWTSAPLAAGIEYGGGAVLWLASPPGPAGYERYPYIPQALARLGLEPPLGSRNLWAFFDSSYRLRADPDYFARRWRQMGIAALHVAAWHYFEADAERDEYLRLLIGACHRRGILVYAWLELPHVSEKFWSIHPEWREKTAILQDAHLDWRRLMNLRNPECARAVSEGLARMIGRFDWDGINLAELYFESLEGAANPSRFTPMNDDVRREFQGLHGTDPYQLFQGAPDASGLRRFLDYRAGLSKALQEHWLSELSGMRARHPHLDLVLTHVDDRYDPHMRDLIGADAARVLPLSARYDFTFLIEDPATLWHLGPERYSDIASKYRPIAPRPRKLAIDINVVERYQDVYPTRQQTGVELFQLVHAAAKSFPRVALYFENSILTPDIPFLSASAATVAQLDRGGVNRSRLGIQCETVTGIPWRGPATVNGKPWPYADRTHVWVPRGTWAIESGTAEPAVRLVDFAGALQSAELNGSALEIGYQADSRSYAFVSRAPRASGEIDGQTVQIESSQQESGWMVELPKGQHLVTLHFDVE